MTWRKTPILHLFRLFSFVEPLLYRMAYKKKRPERRIFTGYLAERVGFEPTVRENRTPDFESGTFDHSATSPLEPDILAESPQRRARWIRVSPDS